MTWVWLLLAITLEVAGTLSLRASEGFRRRLWLLPMGVAYALSFLCLSLSFAAGMHVGVAYGIWTAAGIALIALLARAIWREPLTKRMLAGIAVIAVGVVLIELG